MQFDPLSPKIVLGVVAHPDDLDCWAGGTMAEFAQDGVEIYYLILTDGGNGTIDRSMSSQKLAEIRREEQQAACQLLGVKDIYFCTNTDGCLENTKDVRREVVKAIRQVKPDIVVTMDPSMLYAVELGCINHPDHRAAGQATLDAVYPLARDHLAFPELLEQGYEPHNVRTVLLINFNDYNYNIDISTVFDMKMRAIAAHASQTSDLDVVTKRFTKIAADAGRECGVLYAERFLRIDVQAV
jgi:LmbE family N-acetylglucosaminyl deacetylase